MSPAGRIIQKFGGQTALAKSIGRKQSTVQYWAASGIIPAKWQTPLLALARDRGVDLRPDDFMKTPEEEPEASRPPQAPQGGELRPDTEAPLPQLPAWVMQLLADVAQLKAKITWLQSDVQKLEANVTELQQGEAGIQKTLEALVRTAPNTPEREQPSEPPKDTREYVQAILREIPSWKN